MKSCSKIRQTWEPGEDLKLMLGIGIRHTDLGSNILLSGYNRVEKEPCPSLCNTRYWVSVKEGISPSRNGEKPALGYRWMSSTSSSTTPSAAQAYSNPFVCTLGAVGWPAKSRHTLYITHLNFCHVLVLWIRGEKDGFLPVLQLSTADGTMVWNPLREKHWSNKSKAVPKMQFELTFQII